MANPVEALLGRFPRINPVRTEPLKGVIDISEIPVDLSERLVISERLKGLLTQEKPIRLPRVDANRVLGHASKISGLTEGRRTALVLEGCLDPEAVCAYLLRILHPDRLAITTLDGQGDSTFVQVSGQLGEKVWPSWRSIKDATSQGRNAIVIFGNIRDSCSFVANLREIPGSGALIVCPDGKLER